MSVDSVLNGFAANIRENYSLEIFDVIIPPPDEETGEVPPYFDPKKYTEQVCTAISEAQASINRAFLYLYNDLEIPHGEHQNFITINALSEVFRDTPSYSLSTKIFTDKLEYSYTCGQIYHSYSKGCTGDFLRTLYGYIPTSITNTCNYYQSLYDDFIPVISPNPEEPPVPKITQFWNKYSSAFSTAILEHEPQFKSVKNNFSMFYDMITEYKNLAINASKIQAAGFVFVDAKRRTQSVLDNMDTIFKECRNKFKYYDSLVNDLYELWLVTINHVETEYSEESDYEKESLKIKIFSALLLDYVKFYDDSEKLYKNFLTFFTQYGIK